MLWPIIVIARLIVSLFVHLGSVIAFPLHLGVPKQNKKRFRHGFEPECSSCPWRAKAARDYC